MSDFLFQRIQCEKSLIIWILQSCHDSLTPSMHQTDAVLVTEGLDALSGQDADRWNRYRSIHKKNQFLMSRRAISYVLTREFGLDHGLSWQGTPRGCPRLLDVTGRDVATVSLSHSGNVIVIGMDLECQSLGVDCEVVDSIVSEAVFRYLGNSAGCLGGRFSKISRRWLAAIRWTQFEAGWKMLQNAEVLQCDSWSAGSTFEQRGDQKVQFVGRRRTSVRSTWRVDATPEAMFVTKLTPDFIPERRSKGLDVCVSCIHQPGYSTRISDACCASFIAD